MVRAARSELGSGPELGLGLGPGFGLGLGLGLGLTWVRAVVEGYAVVVERYPQLARVGDLVSVRVRVRVGVRIPSRISSAQP